MDDALPVVDGTTRVPSWLLPQGSVWVSRQNVTLSLSKKLDTVAVAVPPSAVKFVEFNDSADPGIVTTTLSGPVAPCQPRYAGVTT